MNIILIPLFISFMLIGGTTVLSWWFKQNHSATQKRLVEWGTAMITPPAERTKEQQHTLIAGVLVIGIYMIIWPFDVIRDLIRYYILKTPFNEL